MAEWIPFIMFLTVCLVLMAGYPVAFSLAGTALLFAFVGMLSGHFDPAYLQALPNRLFGIMQNGTLIAVPLFVLMGIMLEKSRLAEDLLGSMAALFGRFRSGLGVSVVLVGALLAASTGIVGATVVTMGLMSLPIMLKRGYSSSQATGIIAATGTLGQIIPPSIALVLLGDTLSSAYQQAQLNMGIFTPKTVSIGDLFVGAIVPGLILVIFYISYVVLVARPKLAVPQAQIDSKEKVQLLKLLQDLLPPICLIIAVLGSILAGAATPTEAAGVGAFGAILLAAVKGRLSLSRLREVTQGTAEVTSMVFLILIGAAVFSLVFRGFGGEEIVEQFFANLPGGVVTATVLVMLVIFLLGFILDFIEITFVVVPIVGPVLLAMGLDPIWLGVMIAINLQTSFLTPPFGFALFYLRGVAPASVETAAMYRGVIPFIFMQLVLMIMLAIWPQIATWLPELVYGR
ncbi:MAG: TRAP transporter large permease subunit [Porticoccaceae bacterium]|nr:TRAP transporter large permease subunit [Porticoccaceae bacterium]